MLISVITINYNDKIGLENTIKSVSNQSFGNFEFIIIDGNSSDESINVIKKYEKHISYWESEDDTGIYNAYNKGVLKAKGDYLIFLNSGDVFFCNNALKKFSPHLTKNVDIIYGDILVASTPERVKIYPDVLSFKYLLKDSLPHPSTLIKKKCFENFLFDESLKIVSDWKFYIVGICKIKFSYLHIDEVITKFYLDGISSNNPELVKNERETVIKEEFKLFIEDYKQLNLLERKNNTVSFKNKFKKSLKRFFLKK